MEFQIGSSIHDREGERVGKLEHVIIDPSTKQVAELVMGEGGFLGRDVVVPIGAVNAANTDEIRVNLSKDQMGQLQTFTIEEYVAPPPDAIAAYPWAAGALIPGGIAPVGAASGLETIAYTPIVETHREIPEGDVDVEPGTEVWATDGKVGTVREVDIDDQTKRVRSLIIEKGFVFHTDVAVAAEQIANIGSDRITLKVAKADLSS